MGIDILLSLVKNHLHNIAELISLVIAIIYYPYLKRSFMKWFLPFLAFIFIAELIVGYLRYFVHVRSTLGIYYLISIVESAFYGYIFYRFCNLRMLQRIILLFVFISVTGYIVNFIFFGIDGKHFLSNLVMSGFLLAAIALGYIHTLFIDDRSFILISEPGFWVAVGVSLFFSGTSIVFSMHDFILKNDLNLFGVKLYHIVPRVLSIILYSCISIAIILCKTKTKISS